MAKAKKTQTVLYGSKAIVARFQRLAETPPNAVEVYETAKSALISAGFTDKQIHGDKDAAKGSQARKGLLTKPDAERDYRALIAMIRSAVKRVSMNEINKLGKIVEVVNNVVPADNLIIKIEDRTLAQIGDAKVPEVGAGIAASDAVKETEKKVGAAK